jgi:purine-binding chemotaxis protein CheW
MSVVARTTAETASGELALVCRVRRLFVALPLAHVVETMRPLPIDRLSGMPEFVRGVSIVRGAPTPVIDAGKLLGSDDDAATTRFVVLRAAGRVLALSVESVLGVRALAAPESEALPALLAEANPESVAALRVLDQELLVVLRAARIVPESVWSSLEAQPTVQ